MIDTWLVGCMSLLLSEGSSIILKRIPLSELFIVLRSPYDRAFRPEAFRFPFDQSLLDLGIFKCSLITALDL